MRQLILLIHRLERRIAGAMSRKRRIIVDAPVAALLLAILFPSWTRPSENSHRLQRGYSVYVPGPSRLHHHGSLHRGGQSASSRKPSIFIWRGYARMVSKFPNPQPSPATWKPAPPEDQDDDGADHR